MPDYDLKVLSLGAGVQSTCVLLMALEGEIERPDCAIFSDTGWEPQQVYDHLEKLVEICKEKDFPLYVVKRENSKTGSLRSDFLAHFEQFHNGEGNKWTRVGQPPLYVVNKEGDGTDRGGSIWRQCTKEYKVEPIQRKIRELLGYRKHQQVKKRCQQLFGISLDECHRMKDSGVKWIDNHYPLIDLRMDRNNCMKWLERHGWGETPKSACVGCPYHHDHQWRDMKANRPDEWADAVDFDEEIRKQPYPGITGSLYVHRSMVPLSEVDLDTAEDQGQMSLFGDFGEECEGMCGV